MKYIYLISLGIGSVSLYIIEGIGVFNIPITPFLALTFICFAIELYHYLFNKKVTVLNMPIVNLIFFSGILILTLANINTSRITTILYFLVYVVSFYILISYLKEMTINKFVTALKITIYLYFAVILTTNILVILNIYPSWINIEYYFSRSYIDGSLRFSGLALEPSLAAFVITTTYLVYVLHCNNIQKHIPLHFHLIVLYLIYSINSGFGYLLYLIVVSYLNLKWIKKHVLPSIVIGIAVIVLTSQYGVEHYRLGGFVNYLISFDYTYLDNNAAIRVRPLTDYLYTFTNLNIHHWIGHGLGSSTSYFYSLYYYLTNAPTFSAFFAEMIYDLGIIGIILFFVFIYANAEKKHLLITCSIIALLCFNAGINTQVFWWVIILLFSLKIMNSSPLSNDGHASLTKI